MSRILAICLKLLKRQNPGLRLVVSYADPAQGHHGGVYQATGWIYAGTSQPQSHKMLYGKVYHKRSVNSVIGPNSLPYAPKEVKYKYLYPLDAAMREQIAPLAQPYPKTCAAGVVAAQPVIQLAGGGSIPTAALQD